MPNRILTLTVEHSPTTGAFYVHCAECRGLLIAEHSLTEALAAVAPALRELIEAGAVYPTLAGVAPL